ncbi:hypothetical protein ACN47A_09345 [Myxococcus fulvus]|uniref:hypothetical protein n=1 Tax=Myxococcus fulvus TaxID=33 RepID=UPI003B9C9807
MSFIKNYGIFWERHKVDWGGRGAGNKGTLLGYAAGAQECPVDFREQAGVYVLYEGANIASQRVVYVGQAGRGNGPLFKRLRDHLNDRLWNRWARFSWFGVFSVGKGGALIHADINKVFSDGLGTILDHLEGSLIMMFEPPLNRQGARWNGAVEYFQSYDERFADLEDQVEKIREDVEKIRDHLMPQMKK